MDSSCYPLVQASLFDSADGRFVDTGTKVVHFPDHLVLAGDSWDPYPEAHWVGASHRLCSWDSSEARVLQVGPSAGAAVAVAVVEVGLANSAGSET